MEAKRFYYTFGTDPRYPYKGGYVVIEAKDEDQADKVFRAYYPDRNPDLPCLNCAFVYPEEEFFNDWEAVWSKEKCHAYHGIYHPQSNYIVESEYIRARKAR